MRTLSANAGVGDNRLHSVNSLRSTSNNSRSVSSSVVGSQQLASLRLPPLFSSNASSNTVNATHPPTSSSQYQNSGESSGILQAISAAWEIIIGFLGLAGLFVLGQKTSGLFRGRKA